MASEKKGEVKRRPTRICEFEWSIPYFLLLLNVADKGYYSPRFSFAGTSWYLLIYPNSATKHNVAGYISIYLMRTFSYPPVRLQISFGLQTFDGKKVLDSNCMEHCIKDNIERYVITSWISRAEFTERSSELVPSGTLTVLCTMRNLEAAEYEVIENRSTKRKRTEENPWKISESCTSRSSTVIQHDKLLQDFKDLFLKKEDCDVVIKVKGQEFPAHKAILQARSPVLASTFRNDMKEKATGIVEIEDCDPFCFKDFLCVLYCGDMATISAENVFSLFTVADKYDVQDLRMKCVEFIKENLSIDTFCDAITLGLQHSETELTKLTTNFFIKNAPQIILTEKWQLFLAENPTQCNELLIKLLVPSRR